MLYRNPTPTTTITGCALAYRCRNLSVTARAFVAADLYLARLALPTITQVALLTHVSRAHVSAALRTDSERRAAILAGRERLIPPDLKALERVVRTIGVERAFDVICRVIN